MGNHRPATRSLLFDDPLTTLIASCHSERVRLFRRRDLEGEPSVENGGVGWGGVGSVVWSPVSPERLRGLMTNNCYLLALRSLLALTIYQRLGVPILPRASKLPIQSLESINSPSGMGRMT
jgi:hypothetical protein